MLAGDRGSLPSDSHCPGDGQRDGFLEEPSERDGEAIFVSLQSRLLENVLERLFLERLNSGSGQGEGQETAQIAIERARKRVGLQQLQAFLEDRAWFFTIDQNLAPLEAVEVAERRIRCRKRANATIRQPGEIVGSLVGGDGRVGRGVTEGACGFPGRFPDLQAQVDARGSSGSGFPTEMYTIGSRSKYPFTLIGSPLRLASEAERALPLALCVRGVSFCPSSSYSCLERSEFATTGWERGGEALLGVGATPIVCANSSANGVNWL